MPERRHRCDDRCVCPVHRTPLIYWPHGDDHACQDIDCRYGHGMADEQPDELAAARDRGDFLPGGAGWEALQKVIRDKVSAAFDLPEGLTLQWEEIALERRKGGDDDR